MADDLWPVRSITHDSLLPAASSEIKHPLRGPLVGLGCHEIEALRQALVARIDSRCFVGCFTPALHRAPAHIGKLTDETVHTILGIHLEQHVGNRDALLRRM